MKTAAVAAAALIASSLAAASPASALTTPEPQITFVRTSDIWGIEVQHQEQEQRGMRLSLVVQGRYDELPGDPRAVSTGTAVVTSGTHTYSYAFTSKPDWATNIVVPIDDLHVGDPIDISVTATRPTSPDVATLTEKNFDVVRAGITNFSTDRPRIQQTCMSQKVWWNNGQSIETVAYGDQYPNISSTVTFYHHGKKLFTKPVVLRRNGHESFPDSGNRYPKWMSDFYYEWNLRSHPNWAPGTYRWVITVTDKDTGKVYTAKHVPFRILPKGQSCGSSGGGI